MKIFEKLACWQLAQPIRYSKLDIAQAAETPALANEGVEPFGLTGPALPFDQMGDFELAASAISASAKFRTTGTNYGNIQERVPETMTIHHRIGFEEAEALLNGDRSAFQPRPLNNTVPWAVHVESALGTSQIPSEVGARRFTRRPKGSDIWRGSGGYAGSVTWRKRSGVHVVEPHLKPGGVQVGFNPWASF